MTQAKPCRKCLLSEMKDSDQMEIVRNGIEGILAKDRSCEKDYQERLNLCRSCDNLAL